MKIQCERKLLHEGVQAACRVVSGRSTLPILTHLLLDAGEHGLRITATDFEVGLEVVLPQVRVEASGAVTLPGRVLADLLGSLPNAEVSISVDDHLVAEVRCLRSEYKVRGLPAVDFPKLPEPEDPVEAEIPAAALRRLIRETEPAICGDETRALLTGALLQCEDGAVKMVATDTHRLAVACLMVEGLSAEQEVIVPGRSLREVSRLLGEEGTVHVQYTPKQARFTVGHVRVTTRLIEGKFPNFERVIPREWDTRLEVERDEFAASLKRCLAIMGRDGSNRVVFSTDEGLVETLTLSSLAGELGSARESLLVTRTGPALTIAFNGRYLLDALDSLNCDRVALELKGPLAPGLLTPAALSDGHSYLYVVMPMAVEN